MPEPDICFQTAMSGFMWLVFVFCWCTLREEQDHKTHKTPIEARNQEAKVKLNVEPADLRFNRRLDFTFGPRVDSVIYWIHLLVNSLVPA